MTDHDPLSPERPGADEPRKPRSDGEQSRERLLLSAIRLFAEQGYAKTSTREIALAAGTNVAAISYYFGDKAGLYDSCFSHDFSTPQDDIASFAQPHFTLRESLRGFFGQLLEQMQQGDLARSCMRLWLREMLEPSGMWHDKIQRGIKPVHMALVAMLARHAGADAQADQMHRLAFSITGLGLQVMITRDVIDSIRPQLVATPEAVGTWLDTMVLYGEAMVAAEKNKLDKGTA